MEQRTLTHGGLQENESAHSMLFSFRSFDFIHALQLRGKTTKRFVDLAFKALREHYGMRTVLTAAQFRERVSLSAWLKARVTLPDRS